MARAPTTPAAPAELDVVELARALGPPEELNARADAALRAAHDAEAARVMQELFRPVATERPRPAACALVGGAWPADLPGGCVLKNGRGYYYYYYYYYYY